MSFGTDFDSMLTDDFILLVDLCKDPKKVFAPGSDELCIAQHWLENLCRYECEDLADRRLRNVYMSYLCVCLIEGMLKGPFSNMPKKGKLQKANFNVERKPLPTCPLTSIVRERKECMNTNTTPDCERTRCEEEENPPDDVYSTVPSMMDESKSSPAFGGMLRDIFCSGMEGVASLFLDNIKSVPFFGQSIAEASSVSRDSKSTCTDNERPCYNEEMDHNMKTPSSCLIDDEKSSPCLRRCIGNSTICEQPLCTEGLRDCPLSVENYPSDNTRSSVVSGGSMCEDPKPTDMLPNPTCDEEQNDDMYDQCSEIEQEGQQLNEEMYKDISNLLQAISAELRGEAPAGCNPYLESELIRYRDFIADFPSYSCLLNSISSELTLRSFLLLNLQKDLVKLITGDCS